MELNETLKKLRNLFVQYAPAGAVLIDFKINQDQDEYIVLYRYDYREDESCYIINHLNNSGLYDGRFYYNVLSALMDF